MPNKQYPDYKGLAKIEHSGGWSSHDYHDHNKTHLGRHETESKKKGKTPKPRSREALKPVTKTIDMATGKKTPIDPKLEQANKQDLFNRGLK